MDIKSIADLMTVFGFPVVACYFIWRYLTGQFTILINEVKDVIKENTNAMLAVVAVTQHCKDITLSERNDT